MQHSTCSFLFFVSQQRMSRYMPNFALAGVHRGHATSRCIWVQRACKIPCVHRETFREHRARPQSGARFSRFAHGGFKAAGALVETVLHRQTRMSMCHVEQGEDRSRKALRNRGIVGFSLCRPSMSPASHALNMHVAGDCPGGFSGLEAASLTVDRPTCIRRCMMERGFFASQAPGWSW